MKEEFAIVIRLYKLFGYVAVPVLIDRVDASNYYQVVEQIDTTRANRHQGEFTELQRDLIEITEEYNNQNLVNRFTKKKMTFLEFCDSLNPDFIKKHIRPFIERRLVKIVDMLRDSDIQLFLQDNSRSSLGNENRVTIQKDPVETVFNFSKEELQTRYSLTLKHRNKPVTCLNKKAIVLTNFPFRLLMDQSLYFFEDIDGKKLIPFFTKPAILIPRSAEKIWFESFATKAVSRFTINASGFEILEPSPKKSATLSLELDWQNTPVLVLNFLYDDTKFFVGREHEPDITFYIDEYGAFKFKRITRNREWEQKCISKLLQISLIQQESNFKIAFPQEVPQEEKMGQFISLMNDNYDFFAVEGFTIVKSTLRQKYFIEKINLDVKVTMATDWFDVNGTVFFGEHEIPFLQLKDHILTNRKEYLLPDGKIAILPDVWFAKFRILFLFATSTGERSFKINKLHQQIITGIGIGQKDQARFYKEFTEIVEEPLPLPPGLNAELRPYQRQGYNWLSYLYTNKLGGCLADDMGLGKTVQAIALLQMMKNRKTSDSPHTQQVEKGRVVQMSLFETVALPVVKKFNETLPPSLIVMPVILIHNWENEIRKFAPGMMAKKYLGNQRALDPDEFNQCDVVLTSYGVVRNDAEILKTFTFNTIILDESHFAKNPDSKIYRAILELRSYRKLVITGTPIENSLSDLWAQMNFVNRGLLGSLEFFRQNFIEPIEKEGDEVQKQRLQALIQPFIIRRTKNEVAKELPPLTEQIVYCDMTEEQKESYENKKSEIRNLILENIDDPSQKQSSILMLSALTRLRQISNHPILTDETYQYGSGKFHEVMRSIGRVIAGGHKILIYSTFVKYLELVEAQLLVNNWKFVMLTGQMGLKQREKAISDFQRTPDLQLFLLSLGAGGVGINLTAADYVFILDPWWNPAKESQAIQRSHRIGQDKKVFAYHFISRDTVEEKIQILKEKKSGLAETFINSNNPFKSLSRDSIIELLK